MADAFAFILRRTGGPEVLEAEHIDVPRPGPGEVLVRNEAVGLNFIDTYHRSGLYKLPLPSGLGGEGAGVVEAAGPTIWKPVIDVATFGVVVALSPVVMVSAA